MDKLRLTYVKKELYFIILSNKNFQKEFNFVKSITKNSDWNIFLYLKFDEVLNKFKSKLYCRENMYSYINCYFLFFSHEKQSFYETKLFAIEVYLKYMKTH